MEVLELIRRLSGPTAFPAGGCRDLEIRQTHISVVFLTGDRVYKTKKPLDLGFLDYSTRAARQHCCEAEVTLNHRLAPDVYLGVVPLTTTDTGGLEIDGHGPVEEWAVAMRRLPDEATYLARLKAGTLSLRDLHELAVTMADFYTDANRGKEVNRMGSFEVVAGNCRENFSQLQAMPEAAAWSEELTEVAAATERELARVRDLIEARASRGIPRDGHGDLRLEHVYRLPDSGALVIVDCVEFNSRFRYADPVADIAFLAMELELHGRRDLGEEFTAAYLEAAEDEEGAALLDLYIAYRHVVRAKVRWMAASESEIEPAVREAARQRAGEHIRLAAHRLSRVAT